MKKCFLFLVLVSSFCFSQSVPPSGASDPRWSSGFSIYDWTAPLNWPNDATKFLRGDRTWAVPAGGGSVTANSTVPSIPFLSALNTFSDSPLFRFDANTIEQRNGVNNQCQKIYSSYTDAANNAGISVCPSAVVSTITTFKNGTGSIGSLAINVTGAATTGILQTNGANKVRWGSGSGIEFFDKVGSVENIGTAGQFGVGTLTGNFALDGHNDATRTDTVCPTQSVDTSYFIVGTFTINAVQAGATAQTTMSWTDGGNSSAKTAVFNLDLSVATNQIDIAKPIRVKNGTSVTFTTTTAAIGVGSYNARVSCMGHM